MDGSIERILTRGVEEVIDSGHLEKRLSSGEKLRVKLGIDPTSPNLHLGRSIPLLKLKDFQEAGHQVVFIIGDFTGVIGDTSDKDSERPMLKEEEVKQNLKTYLEQAGKIIDIDKCEVKYNSEWLDKLGYKEIGKQADAFSLNEFNSRENISKRLEAGKRVSLRESFYPLMQGYDSVAVKSDVEIGGTDQRFNLLAGRELQRVYGQEPQDIIMNPLIEGLDGRKMSSSWGNTINLTDSGDEMYGKVMSLRDDLIIKYLTLVTRMDLSKIEEIKKDMDGGANPKEAKSVLAKEIVRMYHGEEEAEKALENFEKTFSKGEFPEDAPVLEGESGVKIIDILTDKGIVPSKTEFRRLVESGAVLHYPDRKISDPNELLNEGEMKLRIGKKTFVILRTK